MIHCKDCKWQGRDPELDAVWPRCTNPKTVQVYASEKKLLIARPNFGCVNGEAVNGLDESRRKSRDVFLEVTGFEERIESMRKELDALERRANKIWIQVDTAEDKEDR